MACLALEGLTYIVKKEEKNFAHLWKPYICFLETQIINLKLIFICLYIFIFKQLIYFLFC